MHTLQENTTLQGGKYRIISVLGQGGFGITYLAEQTMLERRVAIKEFYMKELCGRDGSTSHVTIGTEGSRETVTRFREKFLKEARNIAKLNHPNIVKIIDVFEENGTAYYVMEYAEGGSLADKVNRQGYLSEPIATRYILQVAEALAYVHARKMNHLDVKPANIMLTGTDTAVLIDFGLSKQYDIGGQQTSTTPVGISEGYAPMEQYKQGGVGEFSPETDIYALGATFFKLLTGITPPSASDVNEDGVPVDELKAKEVSEKAIEVICEAMKSRKKERMKDMKNFIDGLGSNKGDFLSRKGNEDFTQMIEIAHYQSKNRYFLKNKKLAYFLVPLIVGITGGVAYLVNSIPIWIAPSYITNVDSSRTYTVDNVSFTMKLVKCGSFMMGTNYGGTAEDSPSHDVSITKDYYIGETEVTQALWRKIMGNNPSSNKGDMLPVESVSWEDCQTFITKLNDVTKEKFRLPTEAEWEFAARGGIYSQNYKYIGGNNLNDICWYKDNSAGHSHKVATKKPNELGLYDMGGNISEWCQDWSAMYSKAGQINPVGPLQKPTKGYAHKIIRGGSWDSGAFFLDGDFWSLHPYSRNHIPPTDKGKRVGLRLVVTKEKDFLGNLFNK